MPLSIDDKLGPYEILAPIGQGGMGEVYRAHDSRLNRDVAIKVANAQFTERFTREARAIAALNHPNICQIYDVGPNYLVMEYVEGQDLRGPLDYADALPIIRQIIDGIEAAHEKNLVHRDLKPANIKITPEGVVKILDFGLAKAMERPPSNNGNPDDPPTTIGATQAGAILGTAAYMAPEQAKGKAADKRSDIWSFGVIVYEILTGKRLFQGDTTVEILAAVLNRDPDISAAPRRVHKLLCWCLEKDCKKRLASISDARRLLDEAPPQEAPQSTTRIRVLAEIAGLAMIAAAALGFLYLRSRPPVEESLLKFSVLPPPNVSLGSDYAPAISPDGRKLAFIGRDASGKSMLWVRSLDSLAAQLLPATEGLNTPFWSPDSRSIAFMGETGLKRLDLASGAPRTLCEAVVGDGNNQGGTWSPDGVILLGSAGLQPLLRRVPSGGGACVAATELNRERQERTHLSPQFLPDGRHFLYFARSSRPANTGIVVGSLDSKGTRFLLASSSQGVYTAPGFLLFVRDQTLMAQRFDAGRLQLSGEAFPVAEQIGVSLFGEGMFSASANGVLAFRSSPSANSRLTWFDRLGKSLGTVGPPGDYVNLSLSADGRRVAFQRQSTAGDRDIWQMEIARPVPQRVTVSPSDETNPLWSPDGSTIVFASNREGPLQLFQKPTSGVGSEELLVRTDGDSIPIDWSADGRFLFFRLLNKQGINEAWVLPMAGERKPFGYLQSTEFSQTQPRLSPDGRWLAYAPFYRGRSASEVFLESFPKRGGRWQVSSAGGNFPKWSRNGKELFYIAPNGELMAVSVKVETPPELGTPVPLFNPRILGNARSVQGFRNQYDVAPDGRFLIIVPEDEGAGSSITVILNWAAGLLRGDR